MTFTTIKEFTPGSPLFLIVALVPGVVLLYRKRLAWLGRLWLTVLVAAYWAMSTPAIAHVAATWVSADFHPIANVQEAGGATAIVVLEAGAQHHHARGAEVDALADQSALRVLEAARVYRLLDHPWVIVTGGIARAWPETRSGAELMSDALLKLGIPAERIIVERTALTTHEHAIYVPEILKARRIEGFVLVTSPTHIRRAMKVFHANGMVPVASPAADLADPKPGDSPRQRYLPSHEALRLSEAVLYDLIAMAYYWSRGWI